MIELQNFTDKMRATSSSTDKVQIIKDSDSFIHKVLEYTYNPFKQYYVTSKTCEKNNDLIYIKSLSHITGGGVHSNFKRSIPKGIKFDLNITNLPREYDFIKDNINITDIELMEIFNCGIGLIFIIDKKYYGKFIKRNLFNLIGEIK